MPTSLGSAIARAFMNDNAQRVDIAAIGAKATCIAVKAIIHARKHMQEKGFDLIDTAYFGKFTAEGEEFTKIIFQVYKTEEKVHLKLTSVA